MPDSQTLGLVIAAMLAGLICLRLYWILGRRPGQQTPPRAQPMMSPPAPLPAPVLASGGLQDIQLADPLFDTPKFLEGARSAYGRIVTAFAAGDRDGLRPLLSPEVFAAFDAGIAARTAPPAGFVKLTDARIAGAGVQGREAEITMVFTAEFSSGVIADVWTFARNLDAADPNWILVATSGDAPA